MTPEKALSGLTKEEILNIRREEMRTSQIFSNMNYTPNPSVYQIDDALPWISTFGQLHWSTATDKEKTEGPSRDSLGIMNPELLYFVSTTDYYEEPADDWIYLYKTFNFLPYRTIYNPHNKTITAYITNEKNENESKYNRKYLPIYLSDSNAHDLGYKYAYMDYSNNIGFYKEEKFNKTLKTDVVEITGYYVHGSACGIPGGCNNYAPYWQYYNEFYLRDLPAEFNIKLWKNKPSSPENEADINFKMVFE
jgi:ABC-type antimicrobial peptide transport system permease subunit